MTDWFRNIIGITQFKKISELFVEIETRKCSIENFEERKKFEPYLSNIEGNITISHKLLLKNLHQNNCLASCGMPGTII